jgi:hypothetical protein
MSSFFQIMKIEFWTENRSVFSVFMIFSKTDAEFLNSYVELELNMQISPHQCSFCSGLYTDRFTLQ